MGLILSILAGIFILAVIGVILRDKTSSIQKRGVALAICAAGYVGYSIIGFIVAYVLVALFLIDASGHNLDEDVKKALKNYLTNNNIVKLDNIAEAYFRGLDRPYRKSELSETALKNIHMYGEELLEERELDREFTTPIIRIETPKGIFYALQRTIDEIQQLYDSFTAQGPDVYNVMKADTLGGNRGLSVKDLYSVYQQIISGFSHIQCIDDPEVLLSEDAAKRQTCRKCQHIFSRIFDYYGTMYCKNCMAEVKELEKSGKSMILEINPSEMQASGELEDVFAELNSKQF